MKEELRRLNERLILVNENDPHELKKHELIKRILEEKDCFLKMDINTAFAILRDLKIPEENLKTVYSKLLDPNDAIREL